MSKTLSWVNLLQDIITSGSVLHISQQEYYIAGCTCMDPSTFHVLLACKAAGMLLFDSFARLPCLYSSGLRARVTCRQQSGCPGPLSLIGPVS